MVMVRQDEFYRDLSIPFFDGAVVSALTSLAERRIADGGFIRYDDYRTPEEFADVRDQIQGLEEFVSSCNVGCRPLLMFLPPGFSMDVHRDLEWNGNRECSIVVMAYPLRDIAPTRFYRSKARSSHTVSASWRHGQCRLLNIKQWHNVDNGDTWRANLQISLDTGYREVLDLIAANDLFRGYDCRFDA